MEGTCVGVTVHLFNEIKKNQEETQKYSGSKQKIRKKLKGARLVWKALRNGGVSVCLSEETYFQLQRQKLPLSELNSHLLHRKLPITQFISQ